MHFCSWVKSRLYSCCRLLCELNSGLKPLSRMHLVAVFRSTESVTLGISSVNFKPDYTSLHWVAFYGRLISVKTHAEVMCHSLRRSFKLGLFSLLWPPSDGVAVDGNSVNFLPPPPTSSGPLWLTSGKQHAATSLPTSDELRRGVV